MPSVTIQNAQFDIPEDTNIAAGMALTEAQAAALQSLRVEALRNRFNGRVKTKLGDREALPPEEHTAMQDEINKAAADFSFGQRASRGPRIVDPVEREMQNLAKATVLNAFHARFGRRPGTEELNRLVAQHLEKNGDQLRKIARRNVRDQQEMQAAVDIGEAGEGPAEGYRAAV